MRWSTVLFSVSLLATLHGVSHAQTYSTAFRSPPVSCPSPYVAGSSLPGMPSFSVSAVRLGMPRIDSMPGIEPIPGVGSTLGATPGNSDGGTSTGTAVAPAAPFASGSGSGADSLASAAPQMIGDLISYGPAVVQRNASGTPIGGTVFDNRVAFEISENESPRPTDRVFVTGTYFDGARGIDNRSDIYHGLLGFEKTFLDGTVSLGARLPMQQDTLGGTGIDGLGDLSLIGKYAFINDTRTGTVASAGLMVTVPTAHSDSTNSNAVLIQPWLGGILVRGNAYVLGFSSIIASTGSPDPTLYSLDLGVGYRIYQSSDDRSILSSITPTLEGHLTTSFDNPSSAVNFADQFIVTAGVHFGLCNRAYLTVGAAVPVTGGRPNDFEVIAQFNYRF